MGFTDDLKLGNTYELRSLEYFNYTTYEQMKGNFKPYDIILDNITKIETKCDRLTERTGNICIEYMCNNKESGITTSEADFYVYFVINKNKEDDVYKIPTEDLKNIIKNGNYRTMRGGDGWRSRFYLIPRAIFKDYLQNNNIK